MAARETIRVEVVFALPDRQELVTVHVAANTGCADAINKSGINARFPDLDLATFPIAIWGSSVGPDDQVKDGDRIEILRPLAIDPRDARRQLAIAGKYMGPANAAESDDV